MVLQKRNSYRPYPVAVFFNIYTKIHTYFATECKSVLYYQRKKQNDNKHNRHHTQRRNTDSISRICHPDIWYRTLNR